MKGQRATFDPKGRRTIDEEDEYNKRREEEIRRHMQPKDSDIHSYTKPADYRPVRGDSKSRVL